MKSNDPEISFPPKLYYLFYYYRQEIGEEGFHPPPHVWKGESYHWLHHLLYYPQTQIPREGDRHSHSRRILGIPDLANKNMVLIITH